MRKAVREYTFAYKRYTTEKIKLKYTQTDVHSERREGVYVYVYLRYTVEEIKLKYKETDIHEERK